MDVDPEVAVTRASLEKIAVFANHPLKRILPDDDWSALQIGDEDLISLAFGLQTIARQQNPKATLSRSDISDGKVRDAVILVLSKSGFGKPSSSQADELIRLAKSL